MKCFFPPSIVTERPSATVEGSQAYPVGSPETAKGVDRGLTMGLGSQLFIEEISQGAKPTHTIRSILLT